MTKYIVQGGSPLFGEVHISGAKNAAVAILPAALLVDGVCRIENIPQISDVTVLLKILEQLGAKVRVLNRSDVELDCRHIVTTRAPQELAHKLRASYYLIGALLGRFGEAEVSMPGGCNFGGTRPIDQHVKGFAAMGATVREGDYICAAAEGGRMKGANIYLDVVSVGATMNIMMAAVLAEGTTVIYNAAKEPHIVDLANFLNSMGARVKGAGTDVIRIRGMQHLHHCTYTVIPDQIETGTLMIAAAATRGDVTIHGCIPTHMEALTAKLLEMGVRVTENDDSIRVRPQGEQRAVNVKTQVYPGFPTDLQQPMTALLCMAHGTSTVCETIFEQRFKHLDELRRMGAHIKLVDRTVLIEGVRELYGAPVTVTDLRAGAALVVAGLMAKGVTEIYETSYIDRGYERIEEKLRALGAEIRREKI
mgnify:CR=1 FL=1